MDGTDSSLAGPDARAQAASAPRWSDSLRSLAWPMVIVAAIIAAMTSASILVAYRHELADDASTLQAISELRLAQITNWLAERRAQAQFAATSTVFADLYSRWRDGDAQSAERLISRLVEFRSAGGAQSVLVLDASGNTIFSEAQAASDDPAEMRAAALRAMATGEVQMTPLYGHGEAKPAPRLDIVAPLTRTGKPARGAIVLRIDPEVFLFPTLEAWPYPGLAGVTQLVQRRGDQLVGLRSATNSLPISSPRLLVARFILGEVAFGQAAEGLDYRGTRCSAWCAACPAPSGTSPRRSHARRSSRARCPMHAGS